MNDVPLGLGWVAAVIVVAIVAPVWVALRSTPQPHASRWRWRAVAWGGLGATAGAAAATILLMMLRLPFDGDTAGERIVSGSLGGWVFFSMMIVFVSVVEYALPYLPLLLLWARLGPQLAALETTRPGLALSAGILAVPGTVVTVAAYGVLDSPQGYGGAALIRFGGTVFFLLTASLLLPRLIFPGLQADTFACNGSGRRATAVTAG